MKKRTYKTGDDRGQARLLPPRIDDYVGWDNAVRLLDGFVDGLDLAKLEFSHTDGGGGAGQPAFHPGDLLKLYLYGYINRVRSSRRLEREAVRNLEVIWLLKGLTPGYRTISNFRRVNAAALKGMARHLVGVAGRLGLLGGEVVAIDGSFFDGNASKASIVTKSRLAERLASLERDIALYDETLASNDAAEDTRAGGQEDAQDGAARLAALLRRKEEIEASIAALAASGATQLSRTDADARLLSKSGQVVAGYNVQIAVDGKHKLIVASEVINDGNDTGQLHTMARAAKEALGVDTLTAVADAGYYNGAALQACEEDGIEAYVPEPERGGRAEAQGRFGEDSFAYDPQANQFRCPGNQVFGPCGGKYDASGKWIVRYASSRRACAACPLRERCLTPKGNRREFWRWEHADVTDRHRARMTDGTAMMRQRKALAEHPFGTLKCRAGYRHFLVRGFAKVRGECALMVACYNFTRLITILGFEALMEAVIVIFNTLLLALRHAKRPLSAAQRHGAVGRHRKTDARAPSRRGLLTTYA